MVVLFKLSTNLCGQESEEVYRFKDDASFEYIEEYGYELARNNAEMFGNDGDDDEYFMEYEVLEDMSEEEIVENYGEICDA